MLEQHVGPQADHEGHERQHVTFEPVALDEDEEKWRDQIELELDRNRPDRGDKARRVTQGERVHVLEQQEGREDLGWRDCLLRVDGGDDDDGHQREDSDHPVQKEVAVRDRASPGPFRENEATEHHEQRHAGMALDQERFDRIARRDPAAMAAGPVADDQAVEEQDQDGRHTTDLVNLWKVGAVRTLQFWLLQTRGVPTLEEVMSAVDRAGRL